MSPNILAHDDTDVYAVVAVWALSCKLLVQVVPPEATTHLHEAMIRVTCREREDPLTTFIQLKELKEFNPLE